MKVPNIEFFQSLKAGETIPDGFGARLSQAFKAIVSQSSTTEQQGNSNPQGQPEAPPVPDGLQVSAANGHYSVRISDQNPGVKRDVRYWVEYDRSPQFTNPIQKDLGQSRNWDHFFGDDQLYFRAYSSYGSSPAGKPVYHGDEAQPIGVPGGGPVAAGTLLESQGSGTGAPGQGLVGPGPVPVRTEREANLWKGQGNLPRGFNFIQPAVPFSSGPDSGSGGGGSSAQTLIVDTHANRLASFASVKYPLYTQFYETDRSSWYWVQNATGTVTVTTGTTVTWVSGSHFINTGTGFTASQWPSGTPIYINGVLCRVSVVNSATSITLQAATANAAGVSYSVASGRWVYLAGEYASALADLPTDLGENDTTLVSTRTANGFRFFENDVYFHQLQWKASAWTRGPEDLEHSDAFYSFGAVPSDGGWQACDGSLAVTYLKYDGTTGTRNVPNLNATAAYEKGGGAYSATIATPVVPTSNALTFTGAAATIGTNTFTPVALASNAVTSIDGSTSSYTPAGTINTPTISLPADPISNFPAVRMYRR